MIRLPDGRVLYMTDYVYREKARLRRVDRRAENRCINDTKARTHGPPVDGGVRCAACKATHTKSAGS